MKIGQLKLRMSRRLSMPPEIVFALTRHWILILFFATVGAFGSYAFAVAQSPYYLGTATLLFANEPLVVGYGRTDARRAQDRSLSANVQMLLSDSVLRKIVQAVKLDNTILKTPRPEDKEPEGLRKFIGDLIGKATKVREVVWPEGESDAGEELQLQRAVADFRHRSDVRPNPQTNTVVLRVRGGDRDLVARELDEWTKAFISHLLEMAEQGSDAFISSRKQYWTGLEEKSRQAVEAFRSENPEATKTNQDLVFRELTQLQVLRMDAAQRGTRAGRSQQVQDATRPAEDPDRAALLAQRRALETELIQNLPLYTEDSYKIGALRESIAIVESKLEAPEAEAQEPSEDAVKKLDESIRETMGRYAAISAGLEKLQALEEELKRYEGTRKSYEMLDMERQDKEELSKSVQVQVSDKPQVGWLPNAVNSRNRAALGGVAGLVLSALLAIFIEAAAGKARFKSDITGEFGLPVLAVIPRK